MGLLDDFLKYAQSGASLLAPNSEDVKLRANMPGLLADFTPVLGDAKSVYDGVQSARQGDWLGAGMGALGALPFVPNMAGMVKGSKAIDALRELPKAPRAEAMETARKNAVKMLGLPETNTAMDRAIATGHVPSYHGTNQDIKQFDMDIGGMNNANGGGSREGGLGVWSSDNTDVANSFAQWSDRNLGGGNVMPLMVRMESPLDVSKYSEVKDIVDKHTQFARPSLGVRMMQDVVDTKAARQELLDSGHDSVRLLGTMTDSPDGITKVNQYLSLDPSRIRSRFAAFDPARLHEADLLGQVNPELLPYLIGTGLLGSYGVSQLEPSR